MLRSIMIQRRGRPLATPVLLGAAVFLAGCTAGEGATPQASVTLAAAGAGNPTVALDTDAGTAYVAWIAEEEGRNNVYLSRVAADGGAAGEPVRVNDVPGDAALHEAAPPQVAVGPGGEVYVAWTVSYPVEGRRFPASNLRFARSEDGGRTFAPAVTINHPVEGVATSHNFHNMAVGADGTIYVSWLDTRERDRLRAERVRLASSASHGGAHGAHAAAGDDDLPGSELWVAYSRDGGRSFSAGSVVDRDVCPCCRTGLATGPDGAVYVVWRAIFEGSVRDIGIARSDDGGETFSAPVPVHRDGWVHTGCPHAGPSIAVAADGGVHVTWYTGREGRQGLFYAASADGGRSFGEPVTLVADEWVPPSHARVAAHGDDVWIAWDDRRQSADERQAFLARAHPGTGEPLRVEATLAGSAPDLALAGSTRAVAWLAGDAVQLRFLGGY